MATLLACFLYFIAEHSSFPSSVVRYVTIFVPPGVSVCLQKRAEALQGHTAKDPPQNIYVPQCEENGMYSEIQCHRGTGEYTVGRFERLAELLSGRNIDLTNASFWLTESRILRIRYFERASIAA